MTGIVIAYVTYAAGAVVVALFATEFLGRAGGLAGWGDLPRFLRTVTLWEICLLVLGMVFGLLTARNGWSLASLLGFVGLGAVTTGFAMYAWTVSLPNLAAPNRWVAIVLLAAEVAGLALIVVFSFFTLDATGRRRWDRRPESRPFDAEARPTVALVIPTFNEPPEVVEETIKHACAQQYPLQRYLVVVADDSTDPNSRAAIADACARFDASHVTREDRRGFKAGAINAVARRLPPEVDLIAIVDADYWVQPDFLSSLAGYFSDKRLGFVQTPQDYRNKDQSFLTRWYHRAEAFFYHGIMPSRNEESTIIFCGTMGILRRSAFDAIGGFAEDQICEDAEISVRLAIAGWHSLYVGQSFGKGLVPATFDAYKKQFHRWAFGNVRILRTRWRSILRSHLTARQKFDFLVSNLHWFDGFVVVTIGLILLLLGGLPFFGYGLETHHQFEMALFASVPILILAEGLLRIRSIVSATGRTTIRDSVLIMGVWFAIKMTTFRAVVQCLVGREAPFVRTPKDTGHRLGRVRAAWVALRLTPMETMFGTSLLAVGVANAVPGLGPRPFPEGALFGVWMALYAMFFLAAPIYAYLSYRTLKVEKSGTAAAAPTVRRSMRPSPSRKVGGALRW